MIRSLVLGANGFIGSHLVDSLVAGGHSVRAFDRFSTDELLFTKHDNIEIFPGNYLNSNDLENALKNIDYVFHFISTTTPASAENDPTIDIETNIRISVELFQLCVDANVKRVIFASTGGAIYGSSIENKPHREEDLPLPVSPYAIGKLTIEHYLRYFRAKHGLDSIVLRISNPYGERQPLHRKQGVIPIFLEHLLNDQEITVYGDGSMVRDYIYVKDVADMIVGTFNQVHQYDTYNIGSGLGTSVKEIIDCIQEVTGKKPSINYEPQPTTFVNRVVLNTNRFRKEFHIIPKTSLKNGVAATYQNMTGSEYHDNA